MGIFSNRKSATSARSSIGAASTVNGVEDAETFRVPPGYSIAPPPDVSERVASEVGGLPAPQQYQTARHGSATSGVGFAQHAYSDDEGMQRQQQPHRSTMVTPDGQVVTKEVYHTSYACYDPNCRGEATCTHERFVRPGCEVDNSGNTGGQNVQRVVTTTTTTTTYSGGPTELMAVEVPLAAAAAQPTAIYTMQQQPQAIYTQQPQAMYAMQPQQQQQALYAYQTAQPVVFATPQQQPAVSRPQAAAQMIAVRPQMAVSQPQQYYMAQPAGYACGPAAVATTATPAMVIQTTGPVLVNNGGRPMPATVNGIPVVVPTQAGYKQGHIRF